MSTDNVEATEAVTTEAPGVEATFYDGWGDDLKDDPSLSKFKDEQEIFRSYKELQKTVGYKGDIPKPEAEADEWDTFYGKLGKPADQAGYAHWF